MKTTLISIFILVCSSGIALTQKYEVLKIDKDLGVTMKNDLILDQNNTIWVATDKGVLEYSEDNWILYQNDSILFKHIDRLFVDSKNRIWCISYYHKFLSKTYFGGLFMIDNKRNIFNYSDDIESIIINDINEDKDGNIWVATGKMLTGITNKKNHTFNTSLEIIEGTAVTNVISSTIAKNAPGGVYKFNGRNWESMYSEDLIPIKFVNKIIKSNDDLFFCEDHHGKERLIKYDNEKFIDISDNKNYPGDEVQDIVSDIDGNIWILTADNRLKIFKVNRDNSVLEFYKMNPYRLGFGRFYTFNKSLCVSYIGTFIEYDRRTNTWICPPKQTNQKKKYFISDVSLASDGSFLVADREGIRIYKDGTFLEKRILDNINVNMLTSISNEKIIIGTNGNGLYLLKGDSLEKVTKDSHGQDMPQSYSKLKIEQGNSFYFLTSKGILKISID